MLESETNVFCYEIVMFYSEIEQKSGLYGKLRNFFLNYAVVYQKNN